MRAGQPEAQVAPGTGDWCLKEGGQLVGLSPSHMGSVPTLGVSVRIGLNGGTPGWCVESRRTGWCQKRHHTCGVAKKKRHQAVRANGDIWERI